MCTDGLLERVARTAVTAVPPGKPGARAGRSFPRPLPFQEQPIHVKHTFVTIHEHPPQRRRRSCPPRIRTPCTVMVRHFPNRAQAPKASQDEGPTGVSTGSSNRTMC